MKFFDAVGLEGERTKTNEELDSIYDLVGLEEEFNELIYSLEYNRELEDMLQTLVVNAEVAIENNEVTPAYTTQFIAQLQKISQSFGDAESFVALEDENDFEVALEKSRSLLRKVSFGISKLYSKITLKFKKWEHNITSIYNNLFDDLEKELKTLKTLRDNSTVPLTKEIQIGSHDVLGFDIKRMLVLFGATDKSDPIKALNKIIDIYGNDSIIDKAFTLLESLGEKELKPVIQSKTAVNDLKDALKSASQNGYRTFCDTGKPDFGIVGLDKSKVYIMMRCESKNKESLYWYKMHTISYTDTMFTTNIKMETPKVTDLISTVESALNIRNTRKEMEKKAFNVFSEFPNKLESLDHKMKQKDHDNIIRQIPDVMKAVVKTYYTIPSMAKVLAKTYIKNAKDTGANYRK